MNAESAPRELPSWTAGTGRRSLSAAALVALASLAALAGLPQARALEGDKTMTGTSRMLGMFRAIRSVELDDSRPIKVENFVLQKDITTITFESGKFWLSKPWREGAAPVSGWFSGHARIQMTPPAGVEKEAFKKNYGKDALDVKFTRAYFQFNDNFYDLLKEKPAGEPGGGEEALKGFHERQANFQDLKIDTELPILMDAENAALKQPAFMMEFETPDQGWIGFMYAPMGLPFGELGESIFFRPTQFEMDQPFPIITVFHDKAEYESGRDLGHEDKDLIWIRNYTGEIKVDKDGLLLKPKLNMDIEATAEGVKSVTVAFLSYWGNEQHAFTIDALTDAAGQPIDYIHRNHQLLIVLPKALKKGEKATVSIAYTADYIRPDPSIGSFLDDPSLPPEAVSLAKAKLDAVSQDSATFTLLNTYPWFPQYGFLKRHTFDWTVKVPSTYLAVASGSTKRRWTEEGYNCLQTVETTPVALASVLFGRYVEKSDTSAKPAINVYTLAKQQKEAGNILGEARTIVTEYQKWFGPFPFDELDIAQMGFFYGFGQAPPGLVQLTGEAFLSGATLSDITNLFGGSGIDPSFVHAFIAHEIGHEWWGHAVSWANSNDQWLSESYTEYCSALYVQSTEGQKAFDAKLKSWRDRASRTKDAGPIWLGQRLGQHYTSQIYEKGPYVLHMLRLALQAQAVAGGGTVADGDKLFFDSLRAFIEKFRNQNATTLDLQKVIKATAKVDMDWFFDQWFRGNHWLNIEFKYEVRPTEDGKFLLTATFKQPDKDNVKQTILPMDIHFKDKVITKPVFIQKAEQTLQFKLPVSPEKVTIDDRQDVLADIKYM